MPIEPPGFPTIIRFSELVACIIATPARWPWPYSEPSQACQRTPTAALRSTPIVPLPLRNLAGGRGLPISAFSRCLPSGGCVRARRETLRPGVGAVTWSPVLHPGDEDAPLSFDRRLHVNFRPCRRQRDAARILRDCRPPVLMENGPDARSCSISGEALAGNVPATTAGTIEYRPRDLRGRPSHTRAWLPIADVSERRKLLPSWSRGWWMPSSCSAAAQCWRQVVMLDGEGETLRADPCVLHAYLGV